MYDGLYNVLQLTVRDTWIINYVPHTKIFTCINSFNSHNNPTRWLLSPLNG